MKTTGQIGLALVAIIALVAGATYLSQYGPRSGNNADISSAPALPVKDPAAKRDLGTIAFYALRVEWSESSEGEFEKAMRGYHDFAFRNLSSQTTVVGLDFKNCKCEDAEIMVLEEAQLPAFTNWFGTGAATILAGFQRGPMACISLMAWENLEVPKLFGLNMKWEQLDQTSKKGVSVPANGGGMVRIFFQGRKDLMGPFLVKARLWAEPEGRPSQRTYGELEMPLTYVAPINISAPQLNLETFNANDEKNGAVVVYSATEAGFNLYVTQASPSPLINLQIDDLSSDEIAEYQKTAGVRNRILSAKGVKVTVHERLSDSQRMDLGPFYRKIFLSRDKDDPEETQLVVGGEIRGELVVGAAEDRGRIELKTFRSGKGISKTVTVLAQQPNLNLEEKNIRVFPEILQANMKVRLEPAKPVGSEQRKRWHLHVELNRGFPPGKLPEGSAVFLQIAGSNPPRQIRIPITGMAYQ